MPSLPLRINETNVTSGFDPVAFFKMSLKCNQWSKYNKKIRFNIAHLTYIMHEN